MEIALHSRTLRKSQTMIPLSVELRFVTSAVETNEFPLVWRECELQSYVEKRQILHFAELGEVFANDAAHTRIPTDDASPLSPCEKEMGIIGMGTETRYKSNREQTRVNRLGVFVGMRTETFLSVHHIHVAVQTARKESATVTRPSHVFDSFGMSQLKHLSLVRKHGPNAHCGVKGRGCKQVTVLRVPPHRSDSVCVSREHSIHSCWNLRLGCECPNHSFNST